MNPQALTAARLSGPSRGTVTQVLGHARVTIEPQEGGSVVCDLLDTGLGVLTLEVGDRVVFSPYADGLGGCVLGRLAEFIRPDGSVTRRTVRISVDELILDAQTRVELGTKRAKLLITEDGRVQLTADKFLAKARKVQRFLAPILRLN